MKKLIFTLGICVAGSMAMAQGTNIVQKGHLEFNNSGTSNIWGYVDGTGHEYALVGLTGMDPQGPGSDTSACAIVDVTDPTNPVLKFNIAGPNSIWREIRTWQNYAYITTEGGGGVTIVNLSQLPNSITTKQYTGDGVATGQINAIHALHIDNGKLYLYGGDWQNGHAKVFSLADPWNPVYQGTVSERYVHDGFVKNDTLYSCEIVDGILEIIDATDPNNPQIINSQQTPSAFTHNSWMSTDGNYIYTTDEVPGAFVAAYDISDLGNIMEVDRYKHKSTTAVPHNTYVVNNAAVTGSNTDFLATSYYTEGVTLVDAARPDNLVEVGVFDTNPLTGPDMQGAWGVYPYLPSGNLLISDMQLGLFVLDPTYVRAAYLEGVVKDSVTGLPIPNAIVRNISISIDTRSLLNGVFKVGTVDTGNFQIQFSKTGYVSKKVNFNFQNGSVITTDVLMAPNNTGVQNELNDIDVSVSPNPVTAKSIISYNMEGMTLEDNAKIEVVDLLGKKLKEYQLSANKGEITLGSDLPAKGVYFIKITNGTNVKTIKAVK